MIIRQKELAGANFCRLVRAYECPLVLPFIVLHATLIYSSFYWVDVVTGLIGEELVTKFFVQDEHVQGLLLLLVPIILVFQVVVCLFCYWNATLRYFIFFRAADVTTATHIFLKAKPGSTQRHSILPVTATPTSTTLFYHNRIYTWKDGVFVKPTLPTKLSVKEYKEISKEKTPYWVKASGREWDDGKRNALRGEVCGSVFGKNAYVIPLPAFKELMMEHATSPFFVFQMLCVVLWLLDEYWYAAILTGVMLCLFEATVVKQRLGNMSHLRDIDPPVLHVHLLRGTGTATEDLTSTFLLPGDMLSLQKNLVGESCPADILLTEGSVIVNESMMTGESTPVVKENIQALEDDQKLNVKQSRNHIIYAGTKILQISPNSTGMVLRTGFETAQGSLVRKIAANSTNREIAGGMEAFYFIGCLLVFAVSASAYVLYQGMLDERRSRYKLLLSCTLIITSVIPPELPLELAIAVNMSFMQLHKLKIFCSEPFKIPFAGSLDTCCFDKTGTLTADVMQFMGVSEGGSTTADNKQIAFEAQVVLTGCNSVVFLDKAEKVGGRTQRELSGDSMEVASVKALAWNPSESGGAMRFEKKRGTALHLVARHAFSSSLQRMTTVVSLCKSAGGDESDISSVFSKLAVFPEHKKLLKSASSDATFVVSKGSPESMKTIMLPHTLPETYESDYKRLGENGFRVIALAIRPLDCDPAYAKKLKRGEVEKELYFVGFAVYSCPIRADAGPTVRNLQKANQHVVMITGDHPLTAAWVANETGITSKPHAFLTPEGAWTLSARDDADIAPASLIADKQVDLVASGDVMKQIGDPTWLDAWCTKVTVWARCNPAQKEAIIVSLKKKGCTTLMCGDGTNDVGALTTAHVGVGLLAGCATAEPMKQEQSMVIFPPKL